MKKSTLIIIILISAALAIAAAVAIFSRIRPPKDKYYKPVIYLYPEKETEVSVRLFYNGKLTCTYPAYKNEWQIRAMPDGKLFDKQGKSYSYLFWEGESNFQYNFSSGFCVKGEDTANFLEESLAKQGLSPQQINEFIVFWLPRMQNNPYNIISFQKSAYTENARLEITPKPDTVIRVFMAYKPSKKAVSLPEQSLEAPEKKGFTVIEWGGAEIKGMR